MDFPAIKQPPLSTPPPKLSLFSLPPSKLPGTTTALTPPLTTAAAIPFLWEEAPGKPRPTASSDHDHSPKSSKTVCRSLDLPPRLAAFSPANNNGNNNQRHKLGNNVGIEIIPSPTTVLGGPCDGMYTNSNLTLESSEKVVVVSNSNKSNRKITMPLRKLMRKERSPVKCRSWRWDRDGFGDTDHDGRADRSPPTVKFCSWRWDSFMDMGGGGGSFNSGGKIRKVPRKNSFVFDNNGSTSRFLVNMYGTLKQAMPWRSRR